MHSEALFDFLSSVLSGCEWPNPTNFDATGLTG